MTTEAINLSEVRLVRHETAEALLLQHFSYALEPGDDPREAEMGYLTEKGEEIVVPFDEQVANLQALGMWGFVDTAERTVHMWADSSIPPEHVVMLLGHELGHFANPRPPDLSMDELIEDEDQADLYGEVAAHAYQMLRQFQGETVERPAETFAAVTRARPWAGS